jgi:dolichol-phosphate mannosyltransferase
MKTTFVLPTYNEAENLPLLAEQIFALPEDISLLVVDDNSPDGTGEVADALTRQYPDRVEVLHRTGKQGFASAYLDGFRHALTTDAEAIGMMDSDFSHDPKKLPEMIAAARQADLVIGSRYVPGGSVDKDWHPLRKLLSAFGNLYARTILGVPVRDMTTGFRLWRREALEGFPLERILSNGYVFQVELAYIAYRLGYRIREVPIYFPDRQRGQSKMNLRIQLEAAFRVWQVLFAHRDIHA